MDQSVSWLLTSMHICAKYSFMAYFIHQSLFIRFALQTGFLCSASKSTLSFFDYRLSRFNILFRREIRIVFIAGGWFVGGEPLFKRLHIALEKLLLSGKSILIIDFGNVEYTAAVQAMCGDFIVTKCLPSNGDHLSSDYQRVWNHITALNAKCSWLVFHVCPLLMMRHFLNAISILKNEMNINARSSCHHCLQQYSTGFVPNPILSKTGKP